MKYWKRLLITTIFLWIANLLFNYLDYQIIVMKDVIFALVKAIPLAILLETFFRASMKPAKNS
jgi:hypothetical protein